MMNTFLKNALSAALGVFFALFALSVLSFLALTVLVALASGPKTTVQDPSILRISLSGTLEERTQDDVWSSLLGEGTAEISLEETLQAIRLAKADARIAGIYLEAGILKAGLSSLQDLHHALLDFKRSGKFVVSYGELYTQGSYYVSAAANTLVLNPNGAVDWHGLSAQPVFLKDLLEKVGVKMQVFKVGSYKSAVEPFTSTKMSAENREQITSYLGGVWAEVVADVSGARRLSPETLHANADSCLLMASAEQSQKLGMVDTLLYIDGVKQLLRTYAQVEDDGKLRFVSPADVIEADGQTKRSGKQVAVYYACGDIVDEDISSGTSERLIAAPRVIADLQALGEDEDVCAVVLRINSGGGSANASEQIWRAVSLLNRKKPVVVSMGDVAASGGYYIATGARRIIAMPTTLTGSIGIFGMFPDAGELLNEKLGLKFDVVKTNHYADFGTITRPFHADEARLLQGNVERGYQLFLKRVATARHKSATATDSLAQGRVWTGIQAYERGLVDDLGDLKKAVEYAAKAANETGNCSVVSYPAPESWYERLFVSQRADYLEGKLQMMLGDYYQPLVWLKTLNRQAAIQARIPFALNVE